MSNDHYTFDQVRQWTSAEDMPDNDVAYEFLTPDG
jgi:hypothetical protein